MKRNYLDLSTSHLCEENAEHVLTTPNVIFKEIGIGLYGFPYLEGSFISLSPEIEAYEYEALSILGYKELAIIVGYCIDNDISLIRFDADAPVMDQFETFDW